MNFKEKFKAWWNNDYKTSCPSVGGQAVMEGVMMKGPKCTAITVRKTDGEMTYITKPNKVIGQKHKWLKLPFIRGVANFIIMLADGVKTITESADMAGFDTGEPTKFEKAMAKVFKCKPDDVMMATAVVLAVVLAVGLFILAPLGISELVEKVPSEQGGACPEHNPETEQPVQRGSDAEVHQVLHQDIACILGPGKAGFTHGKSGLHEEDQRCAEQHPDSVRGRERHFPHIHS